MHGETPIVTSRQSSENCILEDASDINDRKAEVNKIDCDLKGYLFDQVPNGAVAS